MEYEKIAPQFGSWAPKFKKFIESPDFDDIFRFLKSEARRPPEGEGKIICPAHPDLFRAFRETPYENLRVIFLLQDPYPWVKGRKPIADGLAMSCSITRVCQPSLDLFYEGIEDDLGKKVVREPDLKYLADQGVLLLNSSLTVEMNKQSSHTGIWDKFTKYLIEEVINFYNQGLLYISFGNNAHVMAKAVMPFLHYGFEVEHPAHAARKNRAWNHQNIFRKVNRILRECNNDEILWDYGDYKTAIEASKSL